MNGAVQDPERMEQSQIAASQPWTSEEQDCSGISLEQSQRRLSWREDKSRRAVNFHGLLLQAQGWPISVCRKSSKGGRRPAWTNKKLPTELRRKKEAYKDHKQDSGDPGGTETL